jgi:hypothetical protein
LEKLCEILDLGNKFVPSLFNKHSNFLNFFLNNLDCNLYNFNKFLFFSKQKYNNSNKENRENRDYNKTFIYYLNKFTNDKKSYIGWQHETLILRQLMIKTLAKKPFSNFVNLKSEQVNILEKFLKEKNFIICSCDKNVGFAIMSKELYSELCNNHLNSNTNTYKKLDLNPLKITTSNIGNKLKNLNQNGHISNKLLNKIDLTQCQIGKFKINPKVHKDEFGVRGLVASIKHPTSSLCFIIDFILKPFVQKTETYLKDSQNLIQYCEEIELDDEDIEITTGDFESLYSNIESNKAISEICNFLKSVDYKNDHIDLFGISEFLKMIFTENIFSYNKNFFRQLIGLAMGCICGPSVANLYLYMLEKKWLYLSRPLVFKRFIDDIVHINKGNLNRTELSAQYDNLKLNFLTKQTVPFLDLNINIDKFRGKMRFNLFIKPTATFQYLHITSNHPYHIFKNIPLSLFLRIKRICSNLTDFFFHARTLFKQLLKRGYEFEFLYGILHLVSHIERKTLIDYKGKKIKDDQFSIRFFMSFDHNYLNLKEDTMNNFDKMKFQYKWLENFKISFTNSIMPNFKMLLIDNFNFKYNKNSFTRKCLTEKCKVCNYVTKISFLKLGNFKLPLKVDSNCKSKGIIYIIICKKCDVYYIGESGFSASERISQHLYDIRRFLPYGTQSSIISKVVSNFSKNHRPKRLTREKNFNICIFKPYRKITEVSEHFNLKGHNIYSHFKFCIFDKGLNDKETRLSVETDLMNIVKLFKPIINKKVPSFKFLNKLCFS